jgi:hypothetical protein
VIRLLVFSEFLSGAGGRRLGWGGTGASAGNCGFFVLHKDDGGRW